MYKDVTIIMVVHDTWAYLFRNRKHVFAEFLSAQEWVREVIFCEPPLPAWIVSAEGKEQVEGLDRANCGGSRDRCEKLFEAEQTAGGLLLAIKAKLLVYAPLGVGPPDLKFPMGNCYGRGDAEKMFAGVQTLLKERNADNVLLWMHSPFAPGMMTETRHQWVVYDCTDDFSRLTWLNADQANQVRRNDEEIARASDLVLAVSQQLMDDKKKWSPNVVRLPNGCDPDHFAPAAKGYRPKPEDLKAISSPILGYFGRGGIGLKLDYPMVLHLAARHPQWNLVFIGPARPDQQDLLLPNIHFLGHRSYTQLPDYADCFDVCILPHLDNALTRSMDPIKLYEYLATGKPVVSTKVAGAGELSSFINIADSWVGFEDAVVTSLSTPDTGQKAARLQRARTLSWEHRCAGVLEALKLHCFKE